MDCRTGWCGFAGAADGVPERRRIVGGIVACGGYFIGGVVGSTGVVGSSGFVSNTGFFSSTGVIAGTGIVQSTGSTIESARRTVCCTDAVQSTGRTVCRSGGADRRHDHAGGGNAPVRPLQQHGRTV